MHDGKRLFTYNVHGELAASAHISFFGNYDVCIRRVVDARTYRDLIFLILENHRSPAGVLCNDFFVHLSSRFRRFRETTRGKKEQKRKRVFRRRFPLGHNITI